MSVVSPVVALELTCLHQINRIELTSQDVLLKLRADLDVQVCDAPSPSLSNIAVNENWTLDLFGRIIVSQAKANGLSPRISAGETIQRNYIGTVRN